MSGYEGAIYIYIYTHTHTHIMSGYEGAIPREAWLLISDDGAAPVGGMEGNIAVLVCGAAVVSAGEWKDNGEGGKRK
jgi:hypothetical protein